MKFLIVLFFFCQIHVSSSIKTVETLELNKYLGRWYETYSSLIQRQTFQRNLVCTTADYSLQADGNIKVVNAGRLKTPTGLGSNITGTATVLDANHPGALRVTFPGTPNLPGANYLIVKLGPTTFGNDGLYEYSVVTTPLKALVWVLARNPETFETNFKDEVFKYLNDNGYNWFWNKPKPTIQGKDCVYL
ncbi:outer membrane lipoprotein Blc [Hydra vulgaris]|uniref:outer membrane lipoprotein Blc n=1 Tax=Hydra vulgaris TaxID=6087 RepID=UPI000192729D|nr:outer membrane lipoprotein Blc [Hydra vulgaris]